MKTAIRNGKIVTYTDTTSVQEKHSLIIENDTILDIGANDGTFLKNFSKKKYNYIGCEPEKNLIGTLKKILNLY